MDVPVADDPKQPDLTAVLALCGELEKTAVEAHYGRLTDGYLDQFDTEDVAHHARCLSKLTSQNPVEVIMTSPDGRDVDLTVLAFDHPFEFSLITGLLAGTGLRIESGDVFTLPKIKTSKRRRDPRKPYRPKPVKRTGLKSAVIIDCFTGRLADEVESFDSWATRFKFSITEVLELLEQGDDTSVKKAKRHVNELVTDKLARHESVGAQVLLPVELRVDQAPGATRLSIVGQDTPAFLYSLATALSLHGLSIQGVQIRSEDNLVRDEIEVVDAKGLPIVDEQMLEQVSLSVLLTKQFTYFLDRSPDPFTALTRFERLTEDLMRRPEQGQWRDLLSNPRAMQDLAKILGTSDFLWEDFIRAQYESLLPIVTPLVEGERFSHTAATLPLRMQEALAGATTLDEKRERLNEFKDSEIFQIDLDHILNPSVDFRELSVRLTLLAEILVAQAAHLAYEHLAERYGEPCEEDGDRATWAIMGLGKLGGIALGYASDIELQFIYSALGNTQGGKDKAISNSEFFELLARETSQFIRTKREGIFEIDLRLRPYGKEGPLASSANHFRSYYGPGGQAHPFEKLALVRMRWMAGDPALGSMIEHMRDEYVYENPDLDLEALWDVWSRQREQKLSGRRLNAKYSPGALVDLEGTLQLLQVTHARRVPQLRTPRLSGVIEALRRAGVVDAAEYADLVGAYHFLRRLINALRMLRGNAQDLFLPDAKSAEYTHLARRMGYEPRGQISPAQQLSDEFDQRTAAIRSFVERHFERPLPGVG